MIKKILSVFIILISTTLPLYSEEAKKDVMPIVVNGDKVEYDYAHRTVSGSGNVSIIYKDMKLTCDRIIIDIDKKEGIAEDNVTLYQEGNTFTQEGNTFTSEKVVYNFEKKRGNLTNGGMESEPWYGKAESMEKIEDTVYKLNKSYVTTCDLVPPHYRIQAKTIKVYLNDRVTAWHAFLYIGDIPIMYFPYYNHPLEDNLPQVTVVPGRNGEWGTYVLTGWRYFLHPDSKGHINLDWRSKRGFAKGVDYKYRLGKFGSGYATFYHLHDKEPDESQELGTELPSERWRTQLRHKWDVDENTFMAGEYHRLSDQVFIKDFFYREEYELEEQPDTYLTLIGAKENYSVTVLYRKKVNDFFTVTERLPEVQMNISLLKLFNHLNLYYKNNSSFVRLNKKHEKDIGRMSHTPTNNYDVTRLDSYNELSYPTQILGFLNINPFVGSRETFYSDDANGNDNVVRDVFTTGVDLYTRFYKIYDIETDFLGLDIHDIRHLIIPSAEHAYIREPNLRPEELKQFDGIDTFRMKNAVDLSIQHKLQTKRRCESGQRKTVDLLSFIISSEFIIKDDYGAEEELQDVKYDLEIQPYDWMYIDADARLNREKREFDTFNADLYVEKNEDFMFGAGYRYEKHENSQIIGHATYHINRENWKKHWAFEIYERYEIQEKEFQEQEYTIIKDLHCWTGEATVRIRNQNDFTFWLIFRLKEFPDLPFFFRTTYRGPEPGNKRREKGEWKVSSTSF